ncbi:hypothetical protein RJ640_029779 [Escallonia rubra]|uniref:Protein kinase domain-containing protein n=1 Tax=Escallonia rubra TaxID=112253 RepID=A0AA88UBW7_9ASTE|nr:hypothetical protein RJ640_029779 [Escallonia rubra]
MAEPASNCAKSSMEHGFTSSGAMTAALVEREPRKNYQGGYMYIILRPLLHGASTSPHTMAEQHDQLITTHAIFKPWSIVPLEFTEHYKPSSVNDNLCIDASPNLLIITLRAFATNVQGHPNEDATERTQTVNILPIAVPAIQVDELREITDSFGKKALTGEGSCGIVYYGILKSGQAAAIKKFDSSEQPDDEYLAQVSMLSRLKHENVVELLGYSVDGGLRVLVYEYASNDSLHDILHGK